MARASRPRPTAGRNARYVLNQLKVENWIVNIPGKGVEHVDMALPANRKRVFRENPRVREFLLSLAKPEVTKVRNFIIHQLERRLGTETVKGGFKHGRTNWRFAQANVDKHPFDVRISFIDGMALEAVNKKISLLELRRLIETFKWDPLKENPLGVLYDEFLAAEKKNPK